MIITTSNLGKRFQRDWIFKNLNHTFTPGVYAITGPNGSGKSTLLQVLWGQMPASTGTITYTSDQKVVPIEEVFSRLVVATPYMELIEEFTLEEAVSFHFSHKTTRAHMSVDEVIERMELGHVRKRAIHQFSSGMKQRVKLGLAFFSEAEMVFLDEPTTNLDRPSVAWYWRNFEEMTENRVVFIGSNLEDEYPPTVHKVHLLDYK